MDSRRTWTMTVAGGASILLGALGMLPVLLAGLLIPAIFVVLIFGGMFGLPKQDLGGSLALAFGALALGGVVAVFASIDFLLLATGLSIWRVSRRARALAIAYAAFAIPLGLLDLWITLAWERIPIYLAPLTLLTPTYALGLLLAFSLIPSWRQSLRRTHTPPTGH